MKKQDIKPGEIIITEGKPLANQEVTRPKLEFGQDAIALYTAFRDNVYSPKSVLYPSCGFDASPSRAFDNVTFVDIEKGNEGCINALREEGFKAVKADISDYIPSESHDLLILLNQVVNPLLCTKHLALGGWIIANNYHRAASTLNSNQDFSLFGGINFVEPDRRKKDFRVDISRNLEGFFQPVKDMAEFRELRAKDYKIHMRIIGSLITSGTIKVDPNASDDEKEKAYRETFREEMPSKKSAERYIFRKIR